jgi:hypothetical protein
VLYLFAICHLPYLGTTTSVISSMSFQKPLSGFRLNAPQAESQAEYGSGEFAGLGDELEDSIRKERTTNGNDLVEEDAIVNDKPQVQRKQSLTLEQHRQMLLQQQVAQVQLEMEQRQEQHKQQHQLQQQQLLQEQQPVIQQNSPPPPPYKVLIAIGIFIIVLLIGLILTVVLVLGGDDANGNGAAVVVPPSAPVSSPSSNPDSNSLSNTPTVDFEGPTLSPKSMLGLIVQRGKLLCGVSDEQPGFSQINQLSGVRNGMDADLVSSIPHWNGQRGYR